MKLFIVLSVIFISVLGEETQQRARIVPVPLQRQQLDNRFADYPEQWEELSHRRNTIESDETNVSTSSLLNGLLNGQHVLRSNINAAAGESSLDNLLNYPDAAQFVAKIKSRLESSTNLSPELCKVLTQVANEKFNTCKVYTGGRGKGCLGRATGEIMHLIGTVEGMQRKPL